MSHDFSPLGSASDLPGEPYEIRALARRYRDTSDEIRRAADRLSKAGNSTDGVWKGLAGKEFPDKARDLAARIQKAESRYRETGTALARFSERAEQAQAEAAGAASAARTAQAHVDATQPVERPADAPVMTPQESADALQRGADHEHYSRQLSTAHTVFHEAKADYDRAARECHDAIHDAAHQDGLKDSWWYRHWSSIVKALAIIAIIVLVVALVVLALPALMAAAGVAMGASLAAGLLTATSVVELAGAALAVAILGMDMDGRLEGHGVTNTTLILDTLAVATVGLSTLVLAPRMAALTAGAERTAVGTRGANVALQSMEDFETVMSRAPLLDLLAGEGLRGMAAQRALGQGLQAMEELEGSLATISGLPGSVALRLLLRDSPGEVNTLLYLAAHDPRYLSTFVKGGLLAGAQGLSTTAVDVAVTKNVLADWREEAELERKGEEIAAETRRHILTTP